jgi:hypothetical protein
MTSFRLQSVKTAPETIVATLRQAVERAQQIDAEYQPAFGVDVYFHGTSQVAAHVDGETVECDYAQCECGQVTGSRCEGIELRDEMVSIEWMPEWLRGSHEAAGNHGRYPANGALRLLVTEACAASIEESDGEWTHRIGS